MAADGHEARPLPPDHAPGQGQVDQRLDVLDAEPVLGDPHAPDDDRRSGLGVHAGEAEHLFPRRSGVALEGVPLLRPQRVGERLEPRRVLAHESVVHPPVLHQVLEDAVEEGDVSAGVDREEVVREPRAEEGALGHGGDPVALQSGLPVGVDDDDPGAPALRLVHVARRDRLVVGYVAADEDEEVRPQPIRVGAGGGGDAQGVLEPDGARGVAYPGGVVHVVGPEEAGHLLRHVVGLVGDAPRRQVERDATRVRRRDPAADEVEGRVPADTGEPRLATPSHHGVGEPSERAQVLRGHPFERRAVGEDVRVQRSHGVQTEQVEAHRAQVYAVYGEVPHPRGAEGAAVADPVPEDAPGEGELVPVRPRRRHHLAVVVRLDLTRPVRDQSGPL